LNKLKIVLLSVLSFCIIYTILNFSVLLVWIEGLNTDLDLFVLIIASITFPTFMYVFFKKKAVFSTIVLLFFTFIAWGDPGHFKKIASDNDPSQILYIIEEKRPLLCCHDAKEQAYHVKFIKFKNFAPGLYYKVDSHKEYHEPEL
jgi:hypothetical protein